METHAPEKRNSPAETDLACDTARQQYQERPAKTCVRHVIYVTNLSSLDVIKFTIRVPTK
ncbi:MAG: hypothetical protein WB814_11330 [Candidatus Sulfotelmatobacter sp.]